MFKSSHLLPALCLTLACPVLTACPLMGREKNDPGSSQDGVLDETDGASDGVTPEPEPDPQDSDSAGDDDPLIPPPQDSGDPDQPADTEGCRGIDFLVVVDNSRSMEDEQKNLIASFPGFLETIRGAVTEGQSTFNVLVTDTDSDSCERVCPTRPNSMCGSPAISCADWEPTACVHRIGAGRRHDGGGQDCGLQQDKRYLSSNDPDEDSAFACLGSQGILGSGNERAMDAMLAAVSPDMLAEDGCNAGFLRQDAILVVLFITDEDDGGDSLLGGPGSQGDPEDWYQALVRAKGGDASAVVVVGLIGDTGEQDAICMPLSNSGSEGAAPSPRLTRFVESFGENGRRGSVCAEDYNPFLQDVVDTISKTCGEFEPPI